MYHTILSIQLPSICSIPYKLHLFQMASLYSDLSCQKDLSLRDHAEEVSGPNLPDVSESLPVDQIIKHPKLEVLESVTAEDLISTLPNAIPNFPTKEECIDVAEVRIDGGFNHNGAQTANLDFNRTFAFSPTDVQLANQILSSIQRRFLLAGDSKTEIDSQKLFTAQADVSKEEMKKSDTSDNAVTFHSQILDDKFVQQIGNDNIKTSLQLDEHSKKDKGNLFQNSQASNISAESDMGGSDMSNDFEQFGKWSHCINTVSSVSSLENSPFPAQGDNSVSTTVKTENDMNVVSQMNGTKKLSKSRHLLPPCRVCGDQASGFHYGANTCEACKVGLISVQL